MKIVVVGAGYAGTIAANTVARRAREVDVVVVNPRPLFVERVRLHEQLAWSGTAARELAEMLDPRIRVVLGTVEHVGDGVLTLGDGRTLPFDLVVVAVGSDAEPAAGTTSIATWESAESARAQLAALHGGDVVTVVGGGLTGIETASEVAQARPDLVVRLVGPTLGDGLSDGGRSRVRHGLRRLDVEVVTDVVTAVETSGSGPDGKVVLRDGGVLPSDLTLWAITRTTSDLARRSGLSVDVDGRALVDAHLRSVDDDRVFVAGDCAAVSGARLACATAIPQGAHAGRTIAGLTRGRPPRAFSMGYAAQAISIGRRDALVQPVRRDDSPCRVHLSGRAAAWVKETVCRYAALGTRTGRFGWLRGPR